MVEQRNTFESRKRAAETMQALARTQGGFWCGTLGDLAGSLGADGPPLLAEGSKRALPSEVIDERDAVRHWVRGVGAAGASDLLMNVFDQSLERRGGPSRPIEWSAWIMDCALVQTDPNSRTSVILAALQALIPEGEWWMGAPDDLVHRVLALAAVDPDRDGSGLWPRAAASIGDLEPHLWAINRALEANGTTLWFYEAEDVATFVFLHVSLSKPTLKDRCTAEDSQSVVGGFDNGIVVFPVRHLETRALVIAGVEGPDAAELGAWLASEAKAGDAFWVRDGRTGEALRVSCDAPGELGTWLVQMADAERL